jgi:hypothetical protein|tara:strand:- start:206 stop:397 length:192 start_codon:yes stop_codon:yes gene_type:complete
MDNNVITLPTKNPDLILTNASEELSACVIKCSEDGLPLESLIGLLDIFKTSLTLELLSPEEEE